MARKKTKKKGDTANSGRRAVLPNAIYKGKPKRARPGKLTRKQQLMKNAADQKRTAEAIDKGKKMAAIEAYAKEHKITVTQAMVRLME